MSKTPGKTRTVYFYETTEGHDLADLPGTGFARVSRKQRAGWMDLVERLFQGGRVALAVHLIDARVADAPADLAMREYLARWGVPALPVAAKWDRLSAGERAGARHRIEAVHGNVIAVSAKTGEGIEDLRRAIRRRIAVARSPSPSDSRSGVGEGESGRIRTPTEG